LAASNPENLSSFLQANGPIHEVRFILNEMLNCVVRFHCSRQILCVKPTSDIENSAVDSAQMRCNLTRLQHDRHPRFQWPAMARIRDVQMVSGQTKLGAHASKTTTLNFFGMYG
jgi:hypothetical protein